MSSLASGREARRIAPNAKKNALAQLADLKNKGIKRSDQFEVCAGRGGGVLAPIDLAVLADPAKVEPQDFGNPSRDQSLNDTLL